MTVRRSLGRCRAAWALQGSGHGGSETPTGGGLWLVSRGPVVGQQEACGRSAGSLCSARLVSGAEGPPRVGSGQSGCRELGAGLHSTSGRAATDTALAEARVRGSDGGERTCLRGYPRGIPSVSGTFKGHMGLFRLLARKYFACEPIGPRAAGQGARGRPAVSNVFPVARVGGAPPSGGGAALWSSPRRRSTRAASGQLGEAGARVRGQPAWNQDHCSRKPGSGYPGGAHGPGSGAREPEALGLWSQAEP